MSEVPLHCWLRPSWGTRERIFVQLCSENSSSQGPNLALTVRRFPSSHDSGRPLTRESMFVELMMLDRKLKASREGSK